MSDARTDCVGGPQGWSPFAIENGWNTIEGVRRLVAENTRLLAEVAGLQHGLGYLVAADGLPAEARRLHEKNAALERCVERLLWGRGHESPAAAAASLIKRASEEKATR